jgi:hypothetical protein
MAHATHYLPFASLVRVRYNLCTHSDEKPSKQIIDRILFYFIFLRPKILPIPRVLQTGLPEISTLKMQRNFFPKKIPSFCVLC